MSLATTPIGRYQTTDRIETTTGSDAQQQLGRMHARMVARYKLTSVPGRPEELVKPGTNRGVSLGYGCKTIRVRPMLGREWIDELTHDFQISEGWSGTLYSILDQHFGRPATPADVHPIVTRDDKHLHSISFPIRPVKKDPPWPVTDNPQR